MPQERGEQPERKEDATRAERDPSPTARGSTNGDQSGQQKDKSQSTEAGKSIELGKKKIKGYKKAKYNWIGWDKVVVAASKK